MIIDFTAELKEITGDKIEIKDGKEVVSLKNVSVNALLAPEQGIDGKEKLDRFILAEKIQKCTEPLELIPEDVAKIKLVIGKIYPALIVGQSYRLLDG